MLRSAEYFVPVADVHCIHLDDATVLASPVSDQRVALTETGQEMWSLLQARPRTIDRLVIALARRSSGQALTMLPDLVREELDRFVSRGFVRRVAA